MTPPEKHLIYLKYIIRQQMLQTFKAPFENLIAIWNTYDKNIATVL